MIRNKFLIKIFKEHLIGKGYNRECYQHPENHKLCIKINLPRTPSSDSDREKKYYQHLLKRNVSWAMVPKYHGDIETNMGLGSVYDLILDDDGSASQTLEHYLAAKNNFNAVLKPFLSLKEYLLQQRIIIMTLHPRNVLCQIKDGAITKLIICDDIGNSDFIPICNYSHYLARLKITRKWTKFEKLLSTKYQILNFQNAQAHIND
ncbi:MAG: hypothetical protein ACJAWS_001228 [Oleiphilaceae bacterium]|jgi:hypothetical protein